MRHTVRLSLDVSAEMHEAVESIAARLHTSKSEALRKAIGLMEIAVQAKEQGKKLVIADQDRRTEVEVIGI